MLLVSLALALTHPVAEIHSLGHALAGGSPPLDSNATHLALLVSESEDGHVDWNASGDPGDTVLFVHDAATGTTRNTRLSPAFGELQFIDGFLYFRVSESAQREDLNGDGDGLDDVLHRIELATFTIENLGLASYGLVSHDGTRGVFAVREASQLQDLDGNGILQGTVLFAMEGHGEPVNLGVAVNGYTLDGGLLAARLNEFDHGDLNGDGDALDQTLALYDFETGVGAHLKVAVTSVNQTGVADYSLTENWLSFRVWESFQGGQDLDGDGAHDGILRFAWSRQTGLFAFLGPSVGGPLDLGEHLVHARVEAVEQRDFNGDHDTDDAVLHTLRADGVVTNFGLAVSQFVGAGPAGCYLEVEEAHQGDLNGDHALDATRAFVLAAQPLELVDLGLDVDEVQVFADGFVSYARPEGALDLNGDGDTLDSIPHVFDVAARTETPIPLAIEAGVWGRVAQSGGVWAVRVHEPSQGDLDLNGDGNSLSSVLHTWRLADGAIRNLSAEVPPTNPGVFFHHVQGRAFFVVSEADQGAESLNADDDTSDLPPRKWTPPKRCARGCSRWLEGNEGSSRPSRRPTRFAWSARQGT